MSNQELINKLNELGINPNQYSLDGPIIEGLVIDVSENYYGDNKTYKEWRVFDQERGNRYNEKVFYKEAEAYQDVYERFEKNKKYYM